jgi:hypothetical protein
MNNFLDDVDDISYSVFEKGKINLTELPDFFESLEYDSQVTVTLKVKEVEIVIEYDPKAEAGTNYYLEINEEEVRLPNSIKSLKDVVEFTINYLKINF